MQVEKFVFKQRNLPEARNPHWMGQFLMHFVEFHGTAPKENLNTTCVDASHLKTRVD